MNKDSDRMIQELYTVILGVPDTGEKGMAKLVYDMDEHLREMNGKVKTNSTWRKAICWVVGLESSALIAVLILVLSNL